MRRTSRRRSISLHPSRNGRCTDVIEYSKVRMSRYLDTSTEDTNGQQSWSSVEDPVVPLEGNLYGHPLAGLIIGKAIWKSSAGTRLGKSSVNWECLFVNRARGLFLSVYRGRYQTGRQDRKHRTDLDKFSWKTLTWENQHHFLTKFNLGCTQRECQISKDIVDELQRLCSNPGFLLGPKKNYQNPELQGNLMQNTISSWSYDMEGRAKKCASKDIANLQIKRLNNFSQSRNTMHGWPSI